MDILYLIKSMYVKPHRSIEFKLWDGKDVILLDVFFFKYYSCLAIKVIGSTHGCKNKCLKLKIGALKLHFLFSSIMQTKTILSN